VTTEDGKWITKLWQPTAIVSAHLNFIGTMHQVHKSYEPGDPRQFKRAGDELKARLVGIEAAWLLLDFIDQLERMNP
jgi:hypothetical protein